MQATAGVAERMAAIGRKLVHDAMPDQHRDFFAKLPFIVAGSVDYQGDVWATLLSGSPGFITSPTPTSLDIVTRVEPGDPAQDGLKDGDAIGLLGIELHSRRRNRANGTVTTRTPHALHLAIGESFGNCPRYIHLRDAAFARDAHAPVETIIDESSELDPAARSTITGRGHVLRRVLRADGTDHRHVDVSHRGGKSRLRPRRRRRSAHDPRLRRQSVLHDARQHRAEWQSRFALHRFRDGATCCS